jgi:uncharacterized protein with GYD domain
VLDHCATLGQFDFMTIIEAKDSKTVAHRSTDLGSGGTVNVMSEPALSVDELRAKLKGSEQLAAAPVVDGKNCAATSSRRRGKA